MVVTPCQHLLTHKLLHLALRYLFLYLLQILLLLNSKCIFEKGGIKILNLLSIYFLVDGYFWGVFKAEADKELRHLLRIPLTYRTYDYPLQGHEMSETTADVDYVLYIFERLTFRIFIFMEDAVHRPLLTHQNSLPSNITLHLHKLWLFLFTFMCLNSNLFTNRFDLLP